MTKSAEQQALELLRKYSGIDLTPEEQEKLKKEAQKILDMKEKQNDKS